LPLLCCALLGGCSGEPAPSSAPAAELTAGPLHWLMLPEEAKQARRLRTGREAVDFLADFWRRRNPEPGSAVNEAARLFHQRVEDADRLYGERGTRGSLTDRGRALLLLGPPPLLRYGQRRIPAWEPGGPSAQPMGRTRLVAVETWVYPLAELDAPLPALLDAEGAVQGGAAELVFLADSPHHTRLVDGERVLELAARALVRGLPAEPRPRAGPPPRPVPPPHPRAAIARLKGRR
jgi:GWxTD domain-containing protein